MASMQEKMLGQLRPASTAAAQIYGVAASTTAIVKTIVICNTTAVATTFRIFANDSGVVWDETTALFYDSAINGNETLLINLFVPLSELGGTIAVRTATSNALNFSVFGVEIS